MMAPCPTSRKRPDECPDGHALRGPDLDVTVSWLPCLCTSGAGQRFGHRNITCHACKTTWYDPPMMASTGYPMPSFECRRWA